MPAPFWDVRLETPGVSVYNLVQLPGLVAVNLHPPATGPEVEFVFGTVEGCEPVDEEFLRQEVERFTQRPVLAMRRRDD